MLVHAKHAMTKEIENYETVQYAEREVHASGYDIERYDMCMLLCNPRFEQTCDVWHEQEIGMATDWGRTCSVCTDKCPLEKKERLCQFVNYIVYNKPVITHDTWAFPIPSIVPETCSFCWCAWCVFVHSSTVCAEIDAVSPNKQACP